MHHENECVTCKKTFLTLKRLEIHTLEIHDTLFQLKLLNNQANYECIHDNCDLKFVSQRDRFNHLIGMHNYDKLDLVNEEKIDIDLISKMTKRNNRIPNFISFGDEAEVAFEIKHKKVAKRRFK